MSLIIDRRLDGKKKSPVNGQRFLKRYRHHVKVSVQDAIDQRSITDADSGRDITILRKGLSESFFQHGIHEFHSGDRIQRPTDCSGQGTGVGQGSDEGEGTDGFVFQVNRDEFLEHLFNDLELSNLLRKALKDSTDYQLKRAGFAADGSPDRLNIVCALRVAHTRHIALSGKDRKVIRTLKRQIRAMEVSSDRAGQQQATDLREAIKALNKKLNSHDIIERRYSSTKWSIYIAKASDGDNWGEDSTKCYDIILDTLLPVCQYFAYVEITDLHHQNLWYESAIIAKSYPDHFAMQHIHSYSDIYSTFRRLFEKKEGTHVSR